MGFTPPRVTRSRPLAITTARRSRCTWDLAEQYGLGDNFFYVGAVLLASQSLVPFGGAGPAAELQDRFRDRHDLPTAHLPQRGERHGVRSRTCSTQQMAGSRGNTMTGHCRTTRTPSSPRLTMVRATGRRTRCGILWPVERRATLRGTIPTSSNGRSFSRTSTTGRFPTFRGSSRKETSRTTRRRMSRKGRRSLARLSIRSRLLRFGIPRPSS